MACWRLCWILCLLFSALAAAETATPNPAPKPRVALDTEMGAIVIELYPDKAPRSVENFLARVKRYYYDGLIFHRVVKNFVIQTGGYTYDLFAKEPGDTVVNESANGLKNRRGTVAMARLADPDSARAQFYINVRDNAHLDPKHGKPGYTVFGRVVEGMTVVDAISRVPVEEDGEFTHRPVEPIRILSARLVPQP